MSFPDGVSMNDQVERLAEYLVSDEYRRLLFRAILARFATTSEHTVEHQKAIDLFEAAFPDVRP
jgi:hypothetical protein